MNLRLVTIFKYGLINPNLTYQFCLELRDLCALRAFVLRIELYPQTNGLNFKVGDEMLEECLWSEGDQ